jgi:hypothetical protein
MLHLDLIVCLVWYVRECCCLCAGKVHLYWEEEVPKRTSLLLGPALVVESDSLQLQDCGWSCLVAFVWHLWVTSVGQCAGLLHEVPKDSFAVAVCCLRRLLCVPGPVFQTQCWPLGCVLQGDCLLCCMFGVEEALVLTEHCMLTETAALELHGGRLGGCSAEPAYMHPASRCVACRAWSWCCCCLGVCTVGGLPILADSGLLGMHVPCSQGCGVPCL